MKWAAFTGKLPLLFNANCLALHLIPKVVTRRLCSSEASAPSAFTEASSSAHTSDSARSRRPSSRDAHYAQQNPFAGRASESLVALRNWNTDGLFSHRSQREGASENSGSNMEKHNVSRMCTS